MNRGTRHLGCVGLVFWLGGAIASPAIAGEIEVDPAMEQISDVRQLRDLSPGDWAYTALQQLVERYNCWQGYPDGTFNGDRLLSRDEFAAGTNACWERLSELARTQTAMAAPSASDLAAIERLQRDFLSEFTLIQQKLAPVDSRVRQIAAAQFSTTTKLSAVVDYAVYAAIGDPRAVPSGSTPGDEELDSEPVLAGNVILDFDTSFNGRDRLRTRLEAGNFARLRRDQTGTDMSALGFGNSRTDRFHPTILFYQIPVGDRGLLRFGPEGITPNSVFPTFNPIVPLSRFGARNPIYRLGFGAGAVFYYQVSDWLGAGVSYLGDLRSAGNPEFGLFDGQFGALAQISLTPSDRFGLGLTYGRYYSPEPSAANNLSRRTGSQFAQQPFGDSTATSADAYGLQTSWQISTDVAIGGWVGYARATAEGSPTVSGLAGSSGDEADIWNWAIAASVRDAGKTGSQFNVLFGMPPRVSNSDLSAREDGDASLLVEVSYRYPLFAKIWVTPGAFVIFDPEHNDANDDIWVVLVRTSLVF